MIEIIEVEFQKLFILTTNKVLLLLLGTLEELQLLLLAVDKRLAFELVVLLGRVDAVVDFVAAYAGAFLLVLFLFPFRRGVGG